MVKLLLKHSWEKKRVNFLLLISFLDLNSNIDNWICVASICFLFILSAVDAAVSEPEEAGGATECSQVPAVSDVGEHAVEVDPQQGDGECCKCTFFKKNEQNGSPVADYKPEHGYFRANRAGC